MASDLESRTSLSNSGYDLTINPKTSSYPFCLVWTPIPGITSVFPVVGHMGIADSKGRIYDFAGPYYINTGDLAFGRTSRYIQLITEKEATADFAQKYDKAIAKWNHTYSKRMHNLFWDNCHSHCKNILNDINYKGFQHWNMGILAVWMFICGVFTRFWYVFLQSIILYLIIAIIVIVK